MGDRELLIRYREGYLSDEEMTRVADRLRVDAALQSMLAEMETVSSVLEASSARSFKPFFSARVMARIQRSETASQANGMYEAMRWMFARVAVACLVVMLGIGAYSALNGGYGGSMVDAMLGLPEATLETALTLGG